MAAPEYVPQPKADQPRSYESPPWSGDVGRVEDYFAPDNLEDLEARLGLAAGGLNPGAAVVFACGLRGAIGGTIERLVGRGFVPHHRRIRRALEVASDVPASLYFEAYEPGPVLDLGAEEAVRAMRERLRKAAY